MKITLSQFQKVDSKTKKKKVKETPKILIKGASINKEKYADYSKSIQISTYKMTKKLEIEYFSFNHLIQISIQSKMN